MIYYIYEVPTRKNGATKDWETRRAYNFNEYQIEPIIVETMEGPDTIEYWQVVGDREWYYADLNGYERGKHYVEMRLNSIKGGMKGGLVTGTINLRNGWTRESSVKGGKLGAETTNRNKRTIPWEHVLEIRAKYKPRVYTRKMLAVEYNTTNNVIKSIIERSSYKLP